MEKKILVSIIIPTYGRANFLEKTIDSILAQTYKNIEIIIIDDNHELKHHKETLSIVKKYMLINNNIKYIFDNENCGGALARNKGILASTGEIITFLDDDDLYLKDKVEKQLNHILEFNLDVSICDMYFLQKNKFLDKRNCYARVNDVTEFLLDGNSYTPMIMCRKSIIEKVNYFTNSPRYQDHILTLKFFEVNAKIKRLPQKLFIHNNHDGHRITLSEKSAQGYLERQNQELKLLNRLSDTNKKKYLFKTALVESKITRSTSYFKALSKLIKLLLCVRNITDLTQILKTIFIITILPKRNL